jgi:hypothetical protein
MVEDSDWKESKGVFRNEKERERFLWWLWRLKVVENSWLGWLWKVSYGGDGVSYGGLLKMRKMGEKIIRT